MVFQPGTWKLSGQANMMRFALIYRGLDATGVA